MNSNSSKNFPGQRESDDNIDLRRYLGLFLSNWYWFALALFVAGLLAYGINTYSEKIYTVTASLLIKEDQGSDMTGLDKLVPGGDIFKSQQNLQNEIGILKSFSVNAKVMQEIPEFHVTIVGVGRRGIAQVRHYKSAPFEIVFDTLNDQRIKVPINLKIRSENTYSIEINGEKISKKEYSFGEKFNEAGFNFIIIKRDSQNFKFNPDMSNRFTFWFNRPEALANSYRSKLNITPVNEDATLVILSVSGVSRLQEADYLNKLMEVYRRKGIEFKNETAEKTIEFIDKQLVLISDSLTVAENKLENFRLANKLIDLSAEGAAIKSKLEKVTQEKIAAELQKQYYDYLADYIKTRNESGEMVSPSIMGVTDQLLRGLVEDLARLQTQKKQLKYNFSGDQPAISLIDSNIEDARIALDENVRNNILNAERTLKDIDSRISEVNGELNKLPGTEKRLINIQRTFDLNNTVYTYMLEKRSEAGIAKASNVSGNRIIDYAEPYNASLIRPKTNRNYIFAIILGLLIPGLYIFFVDQLHNKILDKKDIERGTEAPIIGFVGHNTSKSEIPVIVKPGSSLSESFRTIRTNLKYYLNGETKAVISITSTISGEGKTFVSLNLAAVLAMLGKKTLLVGMDLRKPRLDKILNNSGEIGLSTYLIGETDYDEILTKTEIENLSFLPSGSIPPNPSELLESERMELFMKKVREEFEYVVLDTPPIGIVSDALVMGEYANINIFVIRQKFSFKNTLELIQNIFEKKELKNLAIVVNDIHISGYYGYGLRYGYGFYEGYGYNYGYGQYGSYGHGDYNKYYTED
jgi:capsular exopolysaccharide synthesis family protein